VGVEESGGALAQPERPKAEAPAVAGLPRFRPTASRARATAVAFYVAIAAALFTIAADVYGLRAVDAGLDETADADAMLRTSDTLDLVSGIVQTVTTIVLAVLFLMWFHRSYKNLPALGIGAPPRSAGWAVGSWFVPFVAWVVPLWSANDIWRSGDTEASPSERWDRRPVSPLVAVWWAAWVASTILGNVVGRAWWNAATELEDYRRAYTLDLVSMGATIVAALLALAFVRRATARQEARARQIATEGLPEPDPPPEEDFTIEPAWKPS
jgi:Domain of unknown function (DUF4328)